MNQIVNKDSWWSVRRSRNV